MPSSSRLEQKELERRIVEAARHASLLFPAGDIDLYEEPDMRIKTNTGWLGIEVTELVRPRQGDDRHPPVENERFHQEVIRLAQQKYSDSGSPAADVQVYFLDEQRTKQTDIQGWLRLNSSKHRRDLMAASLAEFVGDRYVHGQGPVTHQLLDRLPTGFAVIHIDAPSGGPWRSSEGGYLQPLTREYLAAAIAKKDALLSKYRANLPDAPIWLLMASGASVSRGVPIPSGFADWTLTFGFDRVLFYSGMDARVLEIRHS